MRSTGSRTDERPTRAARRADALAVLAETFIKHGGAALNGGERHQIVVHVDAETLRTGTAGRCEIEEAHVTACGDRSPNGL